MKSGSGLLLATQLQEHCHNYAGTSIEFIQVCSHFQIITKPAKVKVYKQGQNTAK